jgi:hypothetical protein
MVALAGMGERAAALEQYDALRRQLREELGIDPGAEVQKVYLTILAEGDPGVPERRAAADPEPPVGDGRAAVPARAAAPARPVSRRRGRAVFAGLAVTLLVLAGWSGLRLVTGDAPPGSPDGVTHRPTDRWTWVYGPELGRSPAAEQWAVADVSGLDDGDHNAGFQLRVGPAGGPGAEAGVKVALSGTEWKVEGDDTGESGRVRVAPAGRLRVAISAGNLITMTYDDVPVMTYRLPGAYPGRGIVPAVWQGGLGDVRMTHIRSNAVPAR